MTTLLIPEIELVDNFYPLSRSPPDVPPYLLPEGIAAILSHLERFPNLDEFILYHDFKIDHCTLFDMLTVEEDAEQVPKGGENV